MVDQEVLTYSNRWRKERGEPELTLREIVPDGSDIVAEGVTIFLALRSPGTKLIRFVRYLGRNRANLYDRLA